MNIYSFIIVWVIGDYMDLPEDISEIPDIPDIPEIVTLRTLLVQYTEEITDEKDEYDDYYDFVQGTSPEQKQQCYGAMINFFSLDVRTFLNETEICRKLRRLFVHPTEVLVGKMITNQIICSYVLLDFTLFCMRWVHDVFTASTLTADVKDSKIDALKTGLDNYDSQYSFTSSTISQLFYYTKDPSSPIGVKKEYAQVSKVLSKCISIQSKLEEVGIKRQLYTFACNRIVSLYIERIRNPKLRLTYTSDFDRDDETWKLYVRLKLEPAIRMSTMLRIHKSNKRMAPLLNLISLNRPAWKGGYGNTLRRSSTKRRRHTTRRRRTKHRRH